MSRDAFLQVGLVCMAKRERPIQPPHLARRLYYSSFITLASVASSVHNGVLDCSCLAALVLATSLNYWRRPVHGVRRNLDIAAAVGSLTYQSLIVAPGVADAGARLAYGASLVAAGSCYAAALAADRLLRRKSLACACHIGLHVCANAGNVLLYDALGENALGWERTGGGGGYVANGAAGRGWFWWWWAWGEAGGDGASPR